MIACNPTKYIHRKSTSLINSLLYNDWKSKRRFYWNGKSSEVGRVPQGLWVTLISSCHDYDCHSAILESPRGTWSSPPADLMVSCERVMASIQVLFLTEESCFESSSWKKSKGPSAKWTSILEWKYIDELMMVRGQTLLLFKRIFSFHPFFLYFLPHMKTKRG